MRKRRALKRRVVFYAIAVGVLIFMAIFGEKIAPYDPYEVNMLAIDQPPGEKFLLGTDNLGRDLFSRILTGTRSSIAAMLVITVCTLVIGTVMGVVSGYFGGVLDVVVQKILLIFQSFPGQVMAIAVAGVLGAGLRNAAIALIAIGWTDYARMSRSMALRIRDAGYVFSY